MLVDMKGNDFTLLNYRVRLIQHFEWRFGSGVIIILTDPAAKVVIIEAQCACNDNDDESYDTGTKC